MLLPMCLCAPRRVEECATDDVTGAGPLTAAMASQGAEWWRDGG